MPTPTVDWANAVLEYGHDGADTTLTVNYTIPSGYNMVLVMSGGYQQSDTWAAPTADSKAMNAVGVNARGVYQITQMHYLTTADTSEWPGTGSSKAYTVTTTSTADIAMLVVALKDVDTSAPITDWVGGDGGADPATMDGDLDAPSGTVILMSAAHYNGQATAWEVDSTAIDSGQGHYGSESSVDTSYGWETGASSTSTVTLDFAASQAYSAIAVSIQGTAAADVSVTVPVGNITYTGYAPTVTASGNVSITVPVGSVTYTGYAPTVSSSGNTSIEVPVGNITYTGYAPTVSSSGNTSIEVPVGVLTYLGYAPLVYWTASLYDDFASTTKVDLSEYATHANLSPPHSVDQSNALDAAYLDVGAESGRYHAELLDNSSSVTLHFEDKQGRLDAKIINFPFQYIARNIGIGTQADSQVDPSTSGTPTIFCGIQVHAFGGGYDLDSVEYSHVVVGHRGSIATTTIEGKNTVNSNSNAGSEGNDAVSQTRADLKIVGQADNTILVYYQDPVTTGDYNDDSWTAYNGDGILPSVTGEARSAPDFSSGMAYIGLITYASGSTGVPYVGTADLVEETTVIIVPKGTVAYTGFAPTISVSVVTLITVPVGNITYTGYAPTLSLTGHLILTIPVGNISYTGYSPTISATDHQSIEIPLGSITYTGYAPAASVTGPISITIPVGGITYTGYAPTVTGDIWTVQPDNTTTWTIH